MKPLLYLFGTIVLLIVAVYAVGSFLPSDHTVVGIRSFENPPEDVWFLITDIRQYPIWRTDVARIRSRNNTGDSLSWKETYLNGDVLPFVVVRSRRPHRWMIKLASANLPFAGSWTYDLKPTDIGCRLQITEKGTVDSPFLRFFWRIFVNPNERIDLILDDLESALKTKPAQGDSTTISDTL